MLVFRSYKVEQRDGKRDEQRRLEIYEKFHGEATAEVEKEYESTMKKYKTTSKQRKLSDIDNGEELWHFVEQSSDGISFEVHYCFFL